MENIDQHNTQSTLIVIGNGFDLKCKLKSHYEDYSSKRAENMDSFYKSFLSTLDIVLGSAELNINELIDVNIMNFLHYFDKVSTQEINVWEMIFTIECFDEDEKIAVKWSDIERIIRNYLVTDKGVCKLGEMYKMLQDAAKKNPLMWSRDVETRKIQILIPLVNGIIRQRGNTQLANCLATNSKKKSVITRNENTFYKFMFSELKLFEKDFKKHLQRELSSVQESYQRYANILMSKVSTNPIDKTYIMNFNFTNPFIDFVTNNVHGSLFSTGTSDIIFGIDVSHKKDEEGNIDFVSQAFRFSKTFRKLSQDSSQDIYDLPSREDLKEIIFFGHSLGKEDYAYFQTLFDYYDLYSGNIKIKFKCSRYLEKTIDEVLLEEQEKAFKLLDYYGATMVNKDWGRNLAHKLLLEKRLSIQHISFNPK